ncbi:Sensory box histidine kinase [Labilithrix luteola]|uniref:histidine kinase n=1 Tax=Labilithrix luteola TaxID=1391654 RepID=A0A0K1QGB8_9BACT|nr:Sensory box histidine kinase [Labilithrix luteola]
MALAVIAAYVIAHAAGVLLLGPGTPASRFWSDLCWTGASLTAALQFFRVSRLAPRPQRKGWLLLGIGIVSWLLSILWWSFREVAKGIPAPVFEVPSSAFSIMPVFFVFGLSYFRAAADRERWDELLEGASAFCLVLLIWLSLLYAPLSRVSWSPHELFPVVTRGICYSAALIRGAVLFSRPTNLSRRVARLLLAGLAVLTGAYFEFVTVMVKRGYSSGRPFDALWTLAFALLYLAAEEQLPLLRDKRALPVTRLPAAMTFVWGVVLLSLSIGLLIYRDPTTVNVSLLIAFAMTVLMAVRSDLLLARERRAREESAAALRMREEFLAITAHELRTPLAPMKMHLWMLARRLREADVAAQKSVLSEIVSGLQRNFDRLVRLVEHVVDVAHMERGFAPLERENVDLSLLVHDACQGFREPLARSGGELILDVEPEIRADVDPFRIEGVVTELLTNALKFGAGKPVEVRLRSEADRVTLMVRDYGIGIGREDQARIFGKLERAAPITHYGGLGLGLFLVRSIVEAHGGSVAVTSDPGKGATFTIDLPSANAAVVPAHP